MMYRAAFPLLALLVAGGCSGSDATEPMNPDAESLFRPETPQTLSASSQRSGALRVTKECSQFTRLAGGFCTITSSNIKLIEVGTKVVYTVASGATVLDSDVTLVPPDRGTNKAFGHCRLDLASGVGLCTFSGGTGAFRSFHATAAVASLGRPNWSWSGTYCFSTKSCGDED
jgi:hypothetical protein